MAFIDPAGETAAYLAQLPPEVHARAQAYTQGGHWLLLWGTLVAIAVSWIVIRSGALNGVRNWLESKRPRPWLTAVLVVAVFLILSFILSLPWALYAEWGREKAYGLNNQTWQAWLGEAALSGAITTIAMSLFFAVIYGVIRKAPRTWWLWSGGVTAVFIVVVIVLAPVVIMPLFNDYKDVPAGPVREAIQKLAIDNGVPSDKIYVYNGSKQSSRYTANVAGLFGTARIAISDSMLKSATIAEVRGVVGHEMGHYKHNHSLWMAAAFSVVIMLQFWLIHIAYPTACRLFGANVTGLADPTGLPVVVALLSIIGLLCSPLTNSITRIAESDADVYSLEHANEPDGMAAALVKTIEYRAASPSRLEEILFYDHPAVSVRIRRCMNWKALHPAAVAT